MKTKVKIYILRRERGNFKDEDRYYRERLEVMVLGRVRYKRLQDYVSTKHPDWDVVELTYEIAKPTLQQDITK